MWLIVCHIQHLFDQYLSIDHPSTHSRHSISLIFSWRIRSSPCLKKTIVFVAFLVNVVDIVIAVVVVFALVEIIAVITVIFNYTAIKASP